MSIRNEKLAALAASKQKQDVAKLTAENINLKKQLAVLTADNAKLAAELKKAKSNKKPASLLSSFTDE
jgi:cell division protein FtsB